MADARHLLLALFFVRINHHYSGVCVLGRNMWVRRKTDKFTRLSQPTLADHMCPMSEGKTTSAE